MGRSPVRRLLRALVVRFDKPGFLERFLIVLIILGVALRFATLWTLMPRYDSTAYMAEGDSLARGQGFLAPWGRFDNPYSSAPEPTDLGPVYPLWLALFYRAFGFSIGVTQAAAFILALIVLGVAYVAAKDLYGHRVGLLTCAVLAVNPALVVFPGMEWSDNAPLLFFIVMLWALLRGIRSGGPTHSAIGGLAAAGYALTKAQALNIVVVIIAAAAFLAWRFLEHGSRVARNPATWVFLGAFLAPLIAWMVWGPHPGPVPVSAQPTVGYVATAALVKLAFVVFTVAFTFSFLAPELLRARVRWQTEEGRLLWLAGIGLTALVLVLLVAAVASGKTLGEPLWKAEQARHLVPAIVPLLWLATTPSDGKGVHRLTIMMSKRRIRWSISAVLLVAVPVATWLGTFLDGLFLLTLAVAVHVRPANVRIAFVLILALLVATNGALDVEQAPYVQAGQWLRAHAQPGDVVAVDPWSGYANGTIVPGPTYKYELYPYLADRGMRAVPYEPGVNATYILSYRIDNYSGYRLVMPLYWESFPGPLTRAWNFVVDTGRALILGPSPPVSPEPSAWLLERNP